MNISLLVIRCKDIEISKGFYEVLGLIFQKEKHGKGPEHYSSKLGDLVFELYPSNEKSLVDNTRLGFTVPDIEKIASNLNVVSTYEFNDNIIYVVTDPDGRKVELS